MLFLPSKLIDEIKHTPEAKYLKPFISIKKVNDNKLGINALI